MEIVYTESARRRIGKLGAAAINDFLDELTAAQRSRVLAFLPRVQGFRKNSPFELRERAKTFVTTISHAAHQKYREHDIEWKAFTGLWLCWVRNVFGLDIVDSFEEGDTQSDLVEYIIREAGELSCPREDLEKLALFSYLPDDAKAASFIASRPAREELKSRRILAELPALVEGISQRVDEAIGRISEIEKEQQDASLTNGNRPCVDLEDRHQKAVQRLDAVEHQVSSQTTKLECTARTLGTEINSIEKLLREALDRVDGAYSVADALGKQFSLLRVASTESIERLDELEKRVSKISGQGAIQSATTAAGPPLVDSWDDAVAFVQPTFNSEVETLDGIAAVVRSLTENFCSVGIERDDAESSACIVTAGLVAGQLVNFSGSLADLLADATCASVFGAGHVECEVPMGLCDGKIVLACQEQLVAAPENSPLVLRGANRSAFEIYGAGIRSSVMSRQIGRTDGLAYRALIATASFGPCVLGATESTFALGPTIDSDHLRWSRPKWKKVRPAGLRDVRLESLYKPHDDLPDVLDTVSTLLSGERRPSALRRAVLIRAASALALIPSIGDSARLELLLASWSVPSLKCQGIAEESIRKHVHRVLNGGELKLNLLSTVLDAEHEA